MGKNSEAYLSLRESLDSMVDVVLGEFDLIEMDSDGDDPKSAMETSAYAAFVRQHVTQFIKANAERQKNLWDRQREAVASIHRKGAENMAKPQPQGICRPGQEEGKGICHRPRP